MSLRRQPVLSRELIHRFHSVMARFAPGLVTQLATLRPARLIRRERGWRVPVFASLRI